MYTNMIYVYSINFGQQVGVFYFNIFYQLSEIMGVDNIICKTLQPQLQKYWDNVKFK